MSLSLNPYLAPRDSTKLAASTAFSDSYLDELRQQSEAVKAITEGQTNKKLAKLGMYSPTAATTPPSSTALGSLSAGLEKAAPALGSALGGLFGGLSGSSTPSLAQLASKAAGAPSWLPAGAFDYDLPDLGVFGAST